MKTSRKRNVARKAKNARPSAKNTPRPNPRPAQSEAQDARPAEARPATMQYDGTQAPPAQPTATQSPAQAKTTQPTTPANNGFVSQNRINAQHSTGPRTAEGKAASSQNAFKHGLSIQRHAVLRDEDPAQYAQLLAELREIYEPRSRREDLAVEDIAQCRWALARFDEAEAVCLEKLTHWFNDPEAFAGDEIIGAGESLGHAATVLTDYDDKGRRFVEPNAHYPAFDKIHRYRTHWERKHIRALAEFDRARHARHAEAAELRAEASRLRAEEQARRQAEAHALKQELALAREARQQDLHELRLEQAREKLRRQPPAHSDSAQPESDEDAALRALDALMNAPTLVTEADFLRRTGFVSQNAGQPQEETVLASPTPASASVGQDMPEAR